MDKKVFHGEVTSKDFTCRCFPIFMPLAFIEQRTNLQQIMHYFCIQIAEAQKVTRSVHKRVLLPEAFVL